MMGRRWMVLAGLGFAVFAAGATEAEAQAARGGFERAGGVADHVKIRGGLLFADHTTLARIDSEALGVGTLVDFENDLGLETTSQNARVDGYIRLGRRHQIRAGFIRLDRAADSRLQRPIQWGNQTFNVDVAVNSSMDLTLVPVSYRFAIVKTDQVDLGLSAGVFALFADASIRAPAVSVNESESLNAPLPVLGADVEIALAPRLFLLGGGEYFAITIEDVGGSWRELRAAVEYYPVRNIGAGVGYRYVRLEVDGTQAAQLSGTEIFFDYRMSGPQVYVALAF